MELLKNKRRLGLDVKLALSYAGIFLVAIITSKVLTDWHFIYSFGVLLCWFSVAVLVTRVAISPSNPLLLYLFLITFGLGYLYKSIYTLFVLDAGGKIQSIYAEWWFLTRANIEDGFFFISIFMLFFAFPIFVLKIESPKVKKIIVFNKKMVSYCKLTLFLCLSMILILAILRIKLNIGIMGKVDTNHSVFHTLIFRTQEMIIPGTLVFLMWVFHESKVAKYYVAACIILLIHYVSLSLLSGSKSGIIFFVFLIFCFWYLQGILTKRKLVFIGIAAIFIALSYSYFTFLRSFLIQGYGHNEAVVLAIEKLGAANKLELMGESFFRIAARIIGAEGVWYYLNFIESNAATYLSMLEIVSQKGLSLFFTQDLVGVTRQGDFRSPGLIAMSLIFFGQVGFALFASLCCITIVKCWNMLCKSYLSVPILVNYSVFILNWMSEGTFHIPDIIVFIIFLCFIHLFARVLMTLSNAKFKKLHGH